MEKSNIFILILVVIIIAVAAVGAVNYISSSDNALVNSTNASNNSTNSSTINLNDSTNNVSSNTTTVNDDGSKTVTWSKTNSNGTTESGYITYDKDGNTVEGAGHEVDANGNEIGVG